VVGLDCQTAAWNTLGICASVHHYVNDNSIYTFRDTSRGEIGYLKSKSDRFLEITRFLKQDIDVAIDFINEKIDQIKTWADSTEDIIENIEENPAEYLEKYKDLRTVLRNGINKMKNGAEQLLVDWITTIRSSSRLKQTRQELRRLAHRTKTQVESMNIHLDDLDNSKDPVLLTTDIDRMKILMIETKEKLEAAKSEYESAGLSGRTRILNRDIDDAIDVLTEEMDQIIRWTNSAVLVSQNIDKYPAQYLVKFRSIRTLFKTTLVDLETDAEDYLDQAEFIARTF